MALNDLSIGKLVSLCFFEAT